jgi:peptidoglycan-associated lipoprotein
MSRTSSSITTPTTSAATPGLLSRDATYLVSHPEVKVVIGGYCDERGSNEYNLALGQNRADAAKNALVTAGVAASRIRVISYGKEKPFCSESTEECWQQNRRAGFTDWTGKDAGCPTFADSQLFANRLSGIPQMPGARSQSPRRQVFVAGVRIRF